MSAPGLRATLRARVGRLMLDVALDTGPGTLVLVGPNGAGKSSLLSLLLGALPLQQGSIQVGERVLHDSERGIDVALEERRLGYVPQDYALFPHMTVRQNVAFALSCSPEPPGRAERDRRVDEVITDLRLASLASRRVTALSGGEKQRVALARALVVRPRALLLDEPLSALDVHARHEVRAFLTSCLSGAGLPAIVVTHDAADALSLGGRMAVLEHGRITQSGSMAELFEKPETPFVRSFVARAP